MTFVINHLSYLPFLLWLPGSPEPNFSKYMNFISGLAVFFLLCYLCSFSISSGPFVLKVFIFKF